MPRRRGAAILALALLTAPGNLSLLGAWWAADIMACACTKAACCCGPKKPAARHAPCHGAEPDRHGAAFKCHHPAPDLQLPSLVGLAPASTAFAPAPERRLAWSVGPGVPRAGFNRIDPPPPRPLASGS